MAGRLAGHQDVLGPGRACGESERGGTRPRPEGRTLARPLSRSGVRAGFWDVPAIRDAVKTLFDVEYQSDSSYRLLLRLCGPSPGPPDPFDEHRDEPATTRRAAWATTKVKSLSCQGWEVHTARLRSAWSTRPGPAACSPQKRTAHQSGPWTGRGRPSPSSAPSPPTSKKVKLYPIEVNRNTEQTILALDLLQRETEAGKIAVVPDNARSHHARALTGLHGPGQLLERITPIHPPPYAPDHNPVEHVRNTAKSNIANIQHEAPEETFGAFASYIAGRTVDYDFEHWSVWCFLGGGWK